MTSSADLRYRAYVGGVVGAGIVGGLAFLVSLNVTLFQTGYETLVRAHSGEKLILKSVHFGGGEEWCGYYTAGDRSTPLRFVTDHRGLWAEGLTKEWREATLYPERASQLSDWWDSCWSYRDRRSWIDAATEPLAVMFINSRQSVREFGVTSDGRGG